MTWILFFLLTYTWAICIAHFIYNNQKLPVQDREVMSLFAVLFGPITVLAFACYGLIVIISSLVTRK